MPGRLRPPCAAPGGRSFAGNLSKVLAQVRLIHEPASKRNVTEGGIRLKHVLSRQFDAPPDDKNMGGVPEGVPEGA